jgi:hypothetical protein
MMQGVSFEVTTLHTHTQKPDILNHQPLPSPLTVQLTVQNLKPLDPNLMCKPLASNPKPLSLDP